MVIANKTKKNFKLLISLGLTLIVCNVFCNAQSKFIFPENSTEFTVEFPKAPKIESIYVSGKSGKSAQAILSDSYLKAEVLDLGEAEAMRASQLTDGEFSQILMAYATSNGMNYPTITIVQSPLGRAAKLRGYKTIQGSSATFESLWVYGKKQAITLMVAGESNSYPQKATSAFLASLKSNLKSLKSNETTTVGNSNFVKLALPLKVSIEVPKNWWIVDLNEEYKTTVATALEAGLRLQGLELSSGKTINLFRANSTPRTTYASIAINATDSEIDPNELRKASLAEINEISGELKSVLEKQFASMGMKLQEFYGVERKFIGKHPALVIRYKRSGLNDSVIFQMTRLFLGNKEISINLAYRESESVLWKPIIDYMQNSFSVGT